MTSIPSRPDRAAIHRLLARFLCGDGLELGPGHAPFALPYPGTRVKYVDRWEPEANRSLFPELGSAASFPKPHIVADLNTDRLRAVDDGSQDFVIASHVLEHIANPIAQLDDIYRVLRPGGTALILLPDRRCTFDRERQPTPLTHLVAEYWAGTTHVDDAHVEDFLRGTSGWDNSWTDTQRAEHLDWHRRRSIHVHCWTEDEFVGVLEYSITDLKQAWELIDAVFVNDVADGMEFGLVLGKGVDVSDVTECAIRFRDVWQALRERSANRAAADRTGQEKGVEGLQQALVGATERADLAEAKLNVLRNNRLYPLARGVYRAGHGVRSKVARLRK